MPLRLDRSPCRLSGNIQAWQQKTICHRTRDSRRGTDPLSLPETVGRFGLLLIHLSLILSFFLSPPRHSCLWTDDVTGAQSCARPRVCLCACKGAGGRERQEGTSCVADASGNLS
ncbi:unnamed protein product [Protopolystoma xenopodis]|uniref:Uncharacterized protein n=1 Tax=Protopolystoma xenopodis TaxID=117903 RepID=A0A3S5AWU5_9PLAT|nr:unnamed protein product [Protopolystoma xenopodis]